MTNNGTTEKKTSRECPAFLKGYEADLQEIVTAERVRTRYSGIGIQDIILCAVVEKIERYRKEHPTDQEAPVGWSGELHTKTNKEAQT